MLSHDTNCTVHRGCSARTPKRPSSAPSAKFSDDRSPSRPSRKSSMRCVAVNCQTRLLADNCPPLSPTPSSNPSSSHLDRHNSHPPAEASSQWQACGAPSRSYSPTRTARSAATSWRRLSSRSVSRTTTRSATSVSRVPSSAYHFTPIISPSADLSLLADRLPHVPRPRMSLCILADAADIDRAKQIELEYMSVDDLKKCVSSSEF